MQIAMICLTKIVKICSIFVVNLNNNFQLHRNNNNNGNNNNNNNN